MVCIERKYIGRERVAERVLTIVTRRNLQGGGVSVVQIPCTFATGSQEELGPDKHTLSSIVISDIGRSQLLRDADSIGKVSCLPGPVISFPVQVIRTLDASVVEGHHSTER